MALGPRPGLMVLAISASLSLWHGCLCHQFTQGLGRVTGWIWRVLLGTKREEELRVHRVQERQGCGVHELCDGGASVALDRGGDMFKSWKSWKSRS